MNVLKQASDSVEFLSMIGRTQWYGGHENQEVVNAYLADGAFLLAAGSNPYGEPTWLLGWYR